MDILLENKASHVERVGHYNNFTTFRFLVISHLLSDSYLGLLFNVYFGLGIYTHIRGQGVFWVFICTLVNIG